MKMSQVKNRILFCLLLIVAWILISCTAFAVSTLEYGGAAQGNAVLTGPGELTFIITITNVGDEDMPGPVYLYYPDMTETEGFGSPVLAAGESKSWKGTWNVTQQELEDGYVGFIVERTEKDPETGGLTTKMARLKLFITYNAPGIDNSEDHAKEQIYQERRMASEQGFGGDVTVHLELEGKKVIGLVIDTPDETEGIGKRVSETAFTDQFIGKTGPFTFWENGIETISGATVTSTAALKAINSVFEAETGEENGVIIHNDKEVSERIVSAINWIRVIQIEAYKQYSESDWSMPEGAELIEKRQEISGYQQIFDHYEDVQVQRSRQVYDHDEYIVQDNGDGTFTQVSQPVYRTEYYTETEQCAVTRSEPVYDMKYYYTIWRWEPNREVTASGTDHNAAWPEYTLADNERMRMRTEEYRFTVEYTKKQGVTETYRLAKSEWEKINVGDQIFITIERSGAEAYISDEKGKELVSIWKTITDY